MQQHEGTETDSTSSRQQTEFREREHVNSVTTTITNVHHTLHSRMDHTPFNHQPVISCWQSNVENRLKPAWPAVVTEGDLATNRGASAVVYPNIRVWEHQKKMCTHDPSRQHSEILEIL